MKKYLTWYAFKKELERETGRTLLNDDWLTLKPPVPLPWNRTNLEVAVAKLQRNAYRVAPSEETIYAST